MMFQPSIKGDFFRLHVTFIFRGVFVIQVTLAKNSSSTLELIHHTVSNLQPNEVTPKPTPKKVMLQQQHRVTCWHWATKGTSPLQKLVHCPMIRKKTIDEAFPPSHQLETEWSICHTKQTKMKMQTKQWKLLSNLFYVWVGFFRISWGSSKMAINNSSQLLVQLWRNPRHFSLTEMSSNFLLAKEGSMSYST